MSPSAGSVSFYFSFNFGNATDINLARICLQEFKDASRQVKNNIAVSYFDKSTPPEFTAAFPHVGRETYTNGIVQFSKYYTFYIMFKRVIMLTEFLFVFV